MPAPRRQAIAAAVLAALALSPSCAARKEADVAEVAAVVPPQRVSMDDEVLEEFREGIVEYVRLFRKLTERIPIAEPTWSAEQIADRQRQLTVAIQNSRRDKRPGNIFKSEVADAFRRTLDRELSGPGGKAMLREIASGNPRTEGVPQQRNPQSEPKKAFALNVNAYYPDDAPLSSVPPSLLLKLPPLPEEVKYRFVGRHLILRDTEANVILDYLMNVVPDPSAAAPSRDAGTGRVTAPTPAPGGAQLLRLPNKQGSLKFAVIGDWGTGSKEQYQVGEQMAVFHTRFPYTLVLTTGDNIYGTDRPEDFRAKFELPYRKILAAGVKFHASLGNHDNPTQRHYRPFHMGGERFYTFRASAGDAVSRMGGGGVRMFVLDTNYMDKTQLDWLARELGKSGSDWKLAFFHHPLYSSARRHGSSLDVRKILEPVLVKGGVNVVFTGHDHTYERVKPQQGIYHFVSGSAGSLRKGDLRKTDFIDAGYDTDFAFLLVEIEGDNLHFQAVDRLGKTVDAGVVKRPTAQTPASDPAPPVASPVPVPRASPVPQPPPTPAPSATPATPGRARP